jgi:hypothetical protein
MSEASETVFLHHLTDRLKWSVLDAPSTVQVLDMDENNEPQYIPLFGSPPHALAALPITSPARSCMLVFNALVECSEYWQDSGDPAPAPLVIENLDGRPISVAQFITELHDYTLRLRDLMYEIEDRAHEEEAVYTFFSVSGPKRGDAADVDARFMVDFVSDVVKDDEMLEGIWAQNMQRFVEQQRG